MYKRLFPGLAVLLALGVPLLALAHGISETDQQRMLDGGYLMYVMLGATHMLTGYDHLLFLLGVVFFLTGFRDIARFVTVFTLGHSITLIFATFFQITWNFYLVDAVIAISVIYKGFDNNGGFQRVFDMKSPNLLGAVFVFGLLHGFGLSTRLQQLPLGDDPMAMLGRILSFNVGVELGQIAALTVMV
ncbi:MAG: HupE/UreJ family protein, partial [Polaromonas sp.]|nr:HupE/UreJ family protein [Polaromonas sp.]